MRVTTKRQIMVQFFNGLTGSIGKDKNSKPTIRPNVKYLVFQPGSTFTLTCENKLANVTWKSPDNFRIPPAAKTVRSTTSRRIPNPENYIIFAKLTVSNATYADTGYYMCQNVEDASAFSEQFVFIPGKKVIVRYFKKCCLELKTKQYLFNYFFFVVALFK